MVTSRDLLERLAKQARLLVDCANRPAAGDDTSGCVVVHDDTHFAHLERALGDAEEHLRRGGSPP